MEKHGKALVAAVAGGVLVALQLAGLLPEALTGLLAALLRPSV